MYIVVVVVEYAASDYCDSALSCSSTRSMEVSLVNGLTNGHEKPMDVNMEMLALKEELERVNANFIQVLIETRAIWVLNN